MSGIVGYVGKRPSQQILLQCLLHLEYRGYDSAGIAISNENIIQMRKEKGQIQDLEASLQLDPIIRGNLGIGHTRWASHGKPSVINSHPLTDHLEKFYVVHNGIIENYRELKKVLLGDGYKFHTDTDTEVIPLLLAKYDTGSFVETVRKVQPMLKGSFALAIMSKSDPNTVIAISHENPLILGFGLDEGFLASDISALLPFTKEIYPIKNNQMAILTPTGIKVETLDGNEIVPEKVIMEWDREEINLQGYEHYMLKEIMEQPKSIQNTLEGKIQHNKVVIPELDSFFHNCDLHQFQKIDIIGNGTSYHSGMVGKKIMEQLIRIPIEVHISSEFTNEHSFLSDKNLVILLSQSGETSDSISAIKEAKKHGCVTIAITNKKRSNIARIADYLVLTKAGPELAVAATKAYTAQITTLLLISLLFIEKSKSINSLDLQLLEGLKELPIVVEQTLVMTQEAIDTFAQVTNDQDHLFLIGRGLDYILALEGALKLQEVAYLHADAYAAGEVKHGTMALITPGVPVIALSTQSHLREKMVSNIRELKTRDAFVVGVTTIGDDAISEVVDQVLYIPETHPFLMPIIAAIPLQLLAYYAGTVRGYNVDRPRNLAKSLTVE